MDITGKDAGFVRGRHDVFFGLDVDKHSIAGSTLYHSKEKRILKTPNNGRMPTNYIHRHFPDKPVAPTHKSGSTGYGFKCKVSKVRSA